VLLIWSEKLSRDETVSSWSGDVGLGPKQVLNVHMFPFKTNMMLCHTYNTALSNLIHQMLVAGVAYNVDFTDSTLLRIAMGVASILHWAPQKLELKARPAPRERVLGGGVPLPNRLA